MTPNWFRFVSKETLATKWNNTQNEIEMHEHQNSHLDVEVHWFHFVWLDCACRVKSEYAMLISRTKQDGCHKIDNEVFFSTVLFTLHSTVQIRSLDFYFNIVDYLWIIWEEKIDLWTLKNSNRREQQSGFSFANRKYCSNVASRAKRKKSVRVESEVKKTKWILENAKALSYQANNVKLF